MVRRTKEEAAATRARILDTAELLFSDKGVSRTSLADIAQAAGVTRGAIYWHFKNKVDLFDAMISRVRLPLEEMARRAANDELDSPLAYVRSCVIDVLRRAATDPQCRRVFEICYHKCEYVDEMATLKERHAESRGGCLENIELGLKNAVRKGELPEQVNTRRAAIALHALIDGMMSNWILDPRYFALVTEGEAMIDAFIAGLRVASETPASHRERRASPRCL